MPRHSLTPSTPTPDSVGVSDAEVTGVEVTQLLDGPLYFIERPHTGVLDVALLRSNGRGVARSHLSALPAGTAVGCAADLRAKEELLRAALARGADEAWFDVAAGKEPRTRYPLQRALDYVRSFKRERACL